MESSVAIDSPPIGNKNFNRDNGRGFLFPSSSPTSSLPPQQEGHLRLLLGDHTGFLGPRPPTTSTSSLRRILPRTNSSLPSCHHLQHHSSRPPILPLPLSRSQSLPHPPEPRKSSAGSRRKPNKPSPIVQSRKTAKAKTEAPPAAADAPIVRAEGDEVEMEEEEKVYSMSPPPSSLPLPRFALRPRTTASAASCNDEASGRVGRRAAKRDAGDGAARSPPSPQSLISPTIDGTQPRRGTNNQQRVWVVSRTLDCGRRLA